jgi:tRNA A37 threonylcarbamoyladenosine modification protein TsaB
VAGVLDAKMGQVYLQAFDGGKALMAPDALEVGAAAARLAELYSDGPPPWSVRARRWSPTSCPARPC